MRVEGLVKAGRYVAFDHFSQDIGHVRLLIVTTAGDFLSVCRSAELSKLAQNAFIAQRISSVNAVSMLCEKTGADLSEVMAVIGTDSRLGAGYLKASSGMGGPTLLQNLKMLVYCECPTSGCIRLIHQWEARHSSGF